MTKEKAPSYVLGALFAWGERRGSNPRPSEPQSDALPTELRPPSAEGFYPESRSTQAELPWEAIFTTEITEHTENFGSYILPRERQGLRKEMFSVCSVISVVE